MRARRAIKDLDPGLPCDAVDSVFDVADTETQRNHHDDAHDAIDRNGPHHSDGKRA